MTAGARSNALVPARVFATRLRSSFRDRIEMGDDVRLTAAVPDDA